MFSLPIFLATLATTLLSVHARSDSTWHLSHFYTPKQISHWTYFTAVDPTHGVVDYKSRNDALALGLIQVTDDTFFMRVDTTPTVPAVNRPSVRITSQDQFRDGVLILNVTHVPTGCSVWPAWWTVTTDLVNWPIGGEIDMYEGANDQFNYNSVSAHTETGCTFDANDSIQTGTVAYTNCSVYSNYNSGCRSDMKGVGLAPTYGPHLNARGGGVMAMERSFGSAGRGVRTWIWDSDSVPADVQQRSRSINTAGWGVPQAHLPIAHCSKYFGPHNQVFDMTLGGDWAGNTYNQSGTCKDTFGTFQDQVKYNGSSFDSAYWAVHGISWYGKGGGDANAANSPYPSSPSSGSNSGSGSGSGSGSDSGSGSTSTSTSTGTSTCSSTSTSTSTTCDSDTATPSPSSATSTPTTGGQKKHRHRKPQRRGDGVF